MSRTEDEVYFGKYPKKRSPLPREIDEIYTEHYKSNREGETPASFLAQRFESWLHKQVARDIADEQGLEILTLEIGAGTLNQLQYEPIVGPYDIVEPFTALYNRSPLLDRIRNIYTDISEIPESLRYDRITSVATFEHICDLPAVVATCGLLLGIDGNLRVSVPSEGTFLWTIGWKLTTGLEFKIKHGIDYKLLLNHEHVNSAKEIEEVLEYFFEEIGCKVLGLTKSFSFYRFYTCRNPKLERCLDYGI